MVKNVILYAPDGGVAGFVEIKVEHGKTVFRLKQDIERELYLSLVFDGKTKVLPVTDFAVNFEAVGALDLEQEIFVCLVRKTGEKVETVASGAINLGKKQPVAENKAVVEIDRALKNICSVDEDGKPKCDTCPYREYFFTPDAAAK